MSWLNNDWCNWVEFEVKSSWLNSCNFLRNNFSFGSLVMFFYVLNSVYRPEIFWWSYIQLALDLTLLRFSWDKTKFFKDTIWKEQLTNTVIRWNMFQIKKFKQEETKYPLLIESTFLYNDFIDLFSVIVFISNCQNDNSNGFPRNLVSELF